MHAMTAHSSGVTASAAKTTSRALLGRPAPSSLPTLQMRRVHLNLRVPLQWPIVHHEPWQENSISSGVIASTAQASSRALLGRPAYCRPATQSPSHPDSVHAVACDDS